MTIFAQKTQQQMILKTSLIEVAYLYFDPELYQEATNINQVFEHFNRV
jgi:hypothetical protein